MHVKVIIVSEALGEVERTLQERLQEFLRKVPQANHTNVIIAQSESNYSGTGKSVTVTIFY